MGIAERKERQKAELRDLILAAARMIFAEEGAAALTMRRIAEVIEYSPGTIYLYFANREEIALQLVREGFEKLLAAFGPALAIADPVERLRAFGQAYLAFGLAEPQSYKLIFMEDAKFAYSVLEPSALEPSEPDDDPGQRAFELLSSTIRAAVASGQFKPVDSEQAADAIWAALHGVLSLSITCPNSIGDVMTVGTLLSDTLIAGLRV
jgi:AcrR family transcriptional regulator